MKFSQVPIGQNFLYRGRRYRKSTPLMAIPENDATPVLLPRSAEIEAESSDTQPAPAAQPRDIPVQQLDQAMNRLAGQLNDIIAESGLNAEDTSATLRRMQAALLETRRNLNLL